MERLYKVLYPIDPPRRTRDRPMQVLALGLPRTGTDSLRKALEILGYNQVHHGFNVIGDPAEGAGWCDLYNAQASGTRISAEDFDKILGHCEAVTDHPASLFGPELIDAYPEAKVILNRRKDLDAWYRSFIELPRGFFTWPSWARGLVDTEEFWMYHFFDIGAYRYWRRDFEKNAIPVYHEHYQRLEDKMKDKEYLSWTVEDGWEPLCKFLDKPVPSEPFPSGNALPEMFQTMLGLMGARAERANRKLLICGATMTLASVAAIRTALKRQ